MNETANLEVKGMHCSDCPAKIEKKVSELEGVTNISVNYKTKQGQVTFNRNQTELSAIIEKISETGFEARKSDG